MVVDISPYVIQDKFPDKKSLEKMLYMAFTCAKKF